MSRSYWRVTPAFWGDEKVAGWNDDTRLLALYLLTCEHRTLEGLFRLPKGYIMADDLWRKFFDQMDGLRNNRGMTIVCIAHEQINKVRNPTLSEDYDAYSLKLNKRAVAIISEWADIIGFASHEVMVRSVESGFNQKETKAITTGARKLHVNPHPAYVAGNRYGMADTSLSWAAFQQGLSAAMTAPTLTT